MENNKINFISFNDFNLNRYLGKWFEIARIQNGFIIDKETHLLYHKATKEEIIEYFKNR